MTSDIGTIILKEFRDFLTTGNLLLLAVGFIMGLASIAIFNSLVSDVLMPIIAIPFGEPDFSALTLTINGSIIMWGSFVTALVLFVLTAIAVFVFIVKPYNAYVARQADKGETPPTEIDLLTEIRDVLRQRSN